MRAMNWLFKITWRNAVKATRANDEAEADRLVRDLYGLDGARGFRRLRAIYSAVYSAAIWS